MDLDSNLVHKNAPEELDKNAAIMTLCLVNGAYMLLCITQFRCSTKRANFKWYQMRSVLTLSVCVPWSGLVVDLQLKMHLLLQLFIKLKIILKKKVFILT